MCSVHSVKINNRDNTKISSSSKKNINPCVISCTRIIIMPRFNQHLSYTKHVNFVPIYIYLIQQKHLKIELT